MLLLKILGLMDILGAFSVLFSATFSARIVKIVGLLIFAKGGFFAFSGDKVSILDVLAGIYIILLSNGHFSIILSAITFIFLMQKGITAMMPAMIW